MTETTNPSPSDPGGATAPTGGIGDGQSMLDAGALQDDGSGLTPANNPPGKDAATDRPSGSLGEALLSRDRGGAGDGDALAPQDTSDPSTTSGGRGEGAL